MGGILARTPRAHIDSLDDTPNLNSLAARPELLREICVRLARDRDVAQDVAQETWLSMLRHPPDPERRFRPWLVQVVRNHVLQRRRSEGRRVQREHLAADSSKLNSAAYDVERRELSERVLSELLALEEPYRSTLMLRFYDGLPPRRIAAEMQVPVETVRTRTKRALEILRERILKRFGGDVDAMLLGLAAVRRSLPPVRAPASITRWTRWFRTRFILAPLISVVAITAIWLRVAVDDRPAGSSSVAQPDSDDDIGTRARWGTALNATERRAEVPAHATLRVRVRSLFDGSPVAFARVTATPSNSEPMRALTDERGEALIELPSDRSVRVEFDRTATTRRSVHQLGPEWASHGIDGVVTFTHDAVPASTASGRVIESDGKSSAGVTVLAFAGPPVFNSSQPTNSIATVITDSEGRFAFEDLPLNFCLLSMAKEFKQSEVWRPVTTAPTNVTDIELALQPTRSLAVEVRNEEGLPVAGAEVVARAGLRSSAGALAPPSHRALCDADGSSVITELPQLTCEVEVRSPGFRTARANVEPNCARVAVALARAPTTVLTVLDERDRPIQGAHVTLCTAELADLDAVTDALGRALFDSTDDFKATFWRVEASGYAVHLGERRKLSASSSFEIVHLETARTLCGQSVDARGIPLAFVHVVARAPADFEWPTAPVRQGLSARRRIAAATMTDELGHFELGGLGSATYEIELREASKDALLATVDWRTEQGPLTLAAGALAPRATRVIGTVHAINADGVNDAVRIRARFLDSVGLCDTSSILVDPATSQFEMLLPHRGKWEFTLNSRSAVGLNRVESIDRDLLDLQFELRPRCTLRLRVVRSDGRALVGVRVIVRSGARRTRASDEAALRTSGFTNQRGELEFDDLPPGPAFIRVAPERDRERFRTRIDIRANDRAWHEVRDDTDRGD